MSSISQTTARAMREMLRHVAIRYRRNQTLTHDDMKFVLGVLDIAAREDDRLPLHKHQTEMLAMLGVLERETAIPLEVE